MKAASEMDKRWAEQALRGTKAKAEAQTVAAARVATFNASRTAGLARMGSSRAQREEKLGKETQRKEERQRAWRRREEQMRQQQSEDTAAARSEARERFAEARQKRALQLDEAAVLADARVALAQAAKRAEASRRAERNEARLLVVIAARERVEEELKQRIAQVEAVGRRKMSQVDSLYEKQRVKDATLPVGPNHGRWVPSSPRRWSSPRATPPPSHRSPPARRRPASADSKVPPMLTPDAPGGPDALASANDVSERCGVCEGRFTSLVGNDALRAVAALRKNLEVQANADGDSVEEAMTRWCQKVGRVSTAGRLCVACLSLFPSLRCLRAPGYRVTYLLSRIVDLHHDLKAAEAVEAAAQAELKRQQDEQRAKAEALRAEQRHERERAAHELLFWKPPGAAPAAAPESAHATRVKHRVIEFIKEA